MTKIAGLIKWPSNILLLLNLKKKIVGFGSLENSAYLDLMYVHEDYTRHGIAKMILDELETEAIKCGSARVTSDVSKTARRFFEKNGFAIVAENCNNIRGVEIMNYKMVKKL